jgi:hypothetical protein
MRLEHTACVNIIEQNRRSDGMSLSCNHPHLTMYLNSLLHPFDLPAHPSPLKTNPTVE